MTVSSSSDMAPKGQERHGPGLLAGVVAMAACLTAMPLSAALLLDAPWRVPVAVLLAVTGVVAAARWAVRLRAVLTTLDRGLDRLVRGRSGAPVSAGGGGELERIAERVNALARKWREANERSEARELALINTLGQVAEGRSRESVNHMTRVGAMSCELARLAGLPDDEVEQLRLAAPLHDLGKVGIPEAIRAKPSAYTPPEREAMKAHAEIGHRILSGSPRAELRAAAVIALTHHERWDGYGYPRGLVGEEIPLHGRIVGLIDAFDAIFSDRTYRRAMSRDRGLGLIRSQREHHFDPRLVDLLLENVPVFFGIIAEHRDARPVRKSTAKRERTPANVGV